MSTPSSIKSCLSDDTHPAHVWTPDGESDAVHCLGRGQLYFTAYDACPPGAEIEEIETGNECLECGKEAWEQVERDGVTWQRCFECGWGELWAAGNLINSRYLFSFTRSEGHAWEVEVEWLREKWHRTVEANAKLRAALRAINDFPINEDLPAEWHFAEVRKIARDATAGMPQSLEA